MNDELLEVERETLLRRIQELQYDLERAQGNTISNSETLERISNDFEKYRNDIRDALTRINHQLIITRDTCDIRPIKSK